MATRMNNAPRDGRRLVREVADVETMLTRLRIWSEDDSKREAMLSTMQEVFSPEGPLQELARVLASIASVFEDCETLDWPESLVKKLPEYINILKARKSLLHSASERDFLAVKEALSTHAEEHQSYRLTFGRWKGRSLQEADDDYLAWLIKERIFDGKPDLEAGLIAGGYLPAHVSRPTWDVSKINWDVSRPTSNRNAEPADET